MSTDLFLDENTRIIGRMCYHKVWLVKWNNEQVICKADLGGGRPDCRNDTIIHHNVDEEYENLKKLYEAGIPVPKPIGIVNVHLKTGVSCKGLLMEYIHGKLLHEFIRDKSISKQLKCTVLEIVLTELAQMNVKGFYHGDLYLHKNIIVNNEIEPKITFIDFEGFFNIYPIACLQKRDQDYMDAIKLTLKNNLSIHII